MALLILGLIVIGSPVAAIVFFSLYLGVNKENKKLRNINKQLNDKLNDMAANESLGLDSNHTMNTQTVNETVVENVTVNEAQAVSQNTFTAASTNEQVTQSKEPPKQNAFMVETTSNVSSSVQNNTKTDSFKLSSLNWIHIGLIVGVIFVLISATIFATTNWKNLPDFVKVIIISMTTVIMYVSSYVSDKFKLSSTSKAFHFIGLSLLAINVVSLAFFNLLPYENALGETVVFLTLSIASFVTGIGSIYSIKKYNYSVVKIACFSLFLASFIFMLAYVPFIIPVKMILLIIFNLAIIGLKYKYKTIDLFNTFRFISLIVGLVFITLTFSAGVFNGLLLYVYGVLFFITADKILKLSNIIIGTSLFVVAAFTIALDFDNVILVFILINALTSLVLLGFKKLNLMLDYVYLITALSVQALSFVMYLILEEYDLLVIFIALIPIVIIYINLWKIKNVLISSISPFLLMVWLVKFMGVTHLNSSGSLCYIIYLIFIVLFIINIFTKTIHRNMFLDMTYIGVFSVMLPTFLPYDSIFILIHALAVFIISNIIIFKEKGNYLYQATSVASLLGFYYLRVAFYDTTKLSFGITTTITFLVIAALSILAIRMYNKKSESVLKTYSEVMSYTFATYIFYLFVLQFAIDIYLLEYILNIIIMFTVFYYLNKQDLFARYVVPYFILIYLYTLINLIMEKLFILLKITELNIIDYIVALIMILLLFGSEFLFKNKFIKAFRVPLYGISSAIVVFNFYSVIVNQKWLLLNNVAVINILMLIAFVGLNIIALYAHSKKPNNELKLYGEATSYAVAVFSLYSCSINLIQSTSILELLLSFALFLTSYYFIYKNGLFARYVLPYFIVLYLSWGIFIIQPDIFELVNLSGYDKSFYIPATVIMLLLWLSELLSKNKCLKLFKIPLYSMSTIFIISMRVTYDSAILVFNLALITSMYIFTLKQKLPNINSTMMSVMAGVWTLIWYNVFSMLVDINELDISKHVQFIIVYLTIIIISVLLKKLFRNKKLFNIFHIASVILCINLFYPILVIPVMYIFLLLAVYVISMYNVIINKYFNLSIISTFIVLVALALISQHLVDIPNLIHVEVILLIVVIAAVIIYLLWRKYYPSSHYFLLAVMILVAVILTSNAMSHNRLFNASIALILCLVLLVGAIIKKNYSWFLPFALINIVLIRYFTSGFWSSLSWWAYLFTAGVVLITIAIVNEVKLKKESKTYKSILEDKFQDWKW